MSQTMLGKWNSSDRPLGCLVFPERTGRRALQEVRRRWKVYGDLPVRNAWAERWMVLMRRLRSSLLVIQTFSKSGDCGGSVLEESRFQGYSSGLRRQTESCASWRSKRSSIRLTWSV